jgi:hypothetical protein
MRYRLTLNAPAAMLDATDREGRTLAGVALPYGQAGNTSMGRLIVDPGSVRLPDELRRVKLFREHGRHVPIGYATAAQDSAEQLRMTFIVGHTPDGDNALLEAAEGLRDGLSVELDNVMVEAGHVLEADLVGVAQVAVPAFASALLTASEAAPEDDDDDEEVEEEEVEEETETPPPVQASRRLQRMTPSRRPRRTPANDRHLFAAAAAEAFRGAADAAQVNAALQDITRTSSGSDVGFLRPEWLGELWTPRAARRPVIEAIGSTPLTSMKWEGWKWDVYPTVDRYAGDKNPIPSSPGHIVPVTGDSYRVAAGWDFDRIYLDFTTGYIEAFLDAATVDYMLKSETWLVAGAPPVVGPPAIAAIPGLIAEATVVAGPQPDLPAALVALAQQLANVGATLDWLVMASNVFGAFAGMTTAEVPWWLQAQGAISLSGGTTDLASMSIATDPNLPAGTLLGGDSEAVDFRETGPIRVQAINLPNGGIDAALYGYQGYIVHDDRGLVTTTVTVAAMAAATRAAKKST